MRTKTLSPLIHPQGLFLVDVNVPWLFNPLICWGHLGCSYSVFLSPFQNPPPLPPSSPITHTQTSFSSKDWRYSLSVPSYSQGTSGRGTCLGRALGRRNGDKAGARTPTQPPPFRTPFYWHCILLGGPKALGSSSPPHPPTPASNTVVLKYLWLCDSDSGRPNGE